MAGKARSYDPFLALMKKVVIDQTTKCWIWQGAVVVSGMKKGLLYGKIQRDGITWLAHRWVYSFFFEDYDPAMDVHHVCGNTLCVYPQHLKLVDPFEHRQQHMFEQWGRPVAEPEFNPWAEASPRDPDDDLPF